MKVTSLEISNFRGIRQARFAFHKRLNVFAGANGSGKTSLLTCLAMLLSRLTVPIAAPTRFGRRFRDFQSVGNGNSPKVTPLQARSHSLAFQITCARP